VILLMIVILFLVAILLVAVTFLFVVILLVIVILLNLGILLGLAIRLILDILRLWFADFGLRTCYVAVSLGQLYDGPGVQGVDALFWRDRLHRKPNDYAARGWTAARRGCSPPSPYRTRGTRAGGSFPLRPCSSSLSPPPRITPPLGVVARRWALPAPPPRLELASSWGAAFSPP